MNVQADYASTAAPAQTRPLVPGSLLIPFDWAAQPLAEIIQSEPRLLTHVFELDRPRMHVIALVLAHLDGRPEPHLAPILFKAPIREVLQRVLGRCPVGAKRVLLRLPSAVLSQQGYLRLVELLDDPRSAKLLHHLEQTEISDSTVRVLYEVPAELRPILAGLVKFIDTLDHLPDGLRWLASLGAASSFDALIADLAGQAQPGQFIARLKDLVSQLPLPENLPPAQIGKARRIDATADICALAKAFKNCLAIYTREVDAGTCAIYLWDDPAAPAVCLVTRQGRLGWCLSEALGPRNAKLDSKQLQEITTAFADAGVPQLSAIFALESILETTINTRARTRRQRRQNLEQRLLELQDTARVQDVIDVDS